MATCNFYESDYIQNLKYVSQELLDIINDQILKNTITPPTPTNMVPCPAYSPTVAAHVFDCTDWAAIKLLLVRPSNFPTDPGGILVTLCTTLNCIIQNVPMSYGLKAQFERFKCLCESLSSKIEAILCKDSCDDIIGDLLCVLVQLLTKLISVVSKAATLVYYAECVSTQENCTNRISIFFECMSCDFVNDLCELEKIANELNAILIAFLTANMQNCTPCGVAKCAAVKHRPMCPPHMMHGGYHGQKPPYGYGHKPGGCGCGCNK